MVYGKHENIEIDINKLVVLPQVRKQKNEKIDELVESIKQNGLINPIDIAIMDLEHFKSHIAFINGLWKTNVDFKTYPSINGLYYVIIAGHTRYQAICQIDKEQNSNSKIYAKVHNAKTSEEILSLQLDENIHTAPRIEERAIAIIECYYLGLQTGKWVTKKDFIKENKSKFSPDVLNDALAFSNLPTKIQEHILNKNIYYQVGVELGKIDTLINDYEKKQLGKNYIEEELNEAIVCEYLIMLNEIQKKQSLKKAIDCIHGYKQMFEDSFKPKDELDQEQISWFNEGVERQSIEYLQRQKLQLNNLKKELSTSKINGMSELLTLITELTGIETSEEKKVLATVSHSYQKTLASNTRKNT